MKSKTPKDGTRLNDYVWVGGKPVAMDMWPKKERSSEIILREHVKSQREYIKRLTESVEMVEAFLAK